MRAARKIGGAVEFERAHSLRKIRTSQNAVHLVKWLKGQVVILAGNRKVAGSNPGGGGSSTRVVGGAPSEIRWRRRETVVEA